MSTTFPHDDSEEHEENIEDWIPAADNLSPATEPTESVFPSTNIFEPKPFDTTNENQAAAPETSEPTDKIEESPFGFTANYDHYTTEIHEETPTAPK